MRGTFAACFRQGLPDDDAALAAEAAAEAQWEQLQPSPPPQQPASAVTCA